MSIQDIFNYLRVSDQLILGGQPTEEQIQAAAAEGVKVVINLATLNRESTLRDEAGLVRSLGMTYHHIPVEWGNPTESDFDAFEKIFREAAKEKTLLHCAANFRVTAFYSLYAMKHLGWSEAQANEFRATIWHESDYPIWEEFIAGIKSKIKEQS